MQSFLERTRLISERGSGAQRRSMQLMTMAMPLCRRDRPGSLVLGTRQELRLPRYRPENSFVPEGSKRVEV